MDKNMIVLLSVLIVTIGNTIGNFLFQKLTGKNDWYTATERSFFQLLAFVEAVFIYVMIPVLFSEVLR